MWRMRARPPPCAAPPRRPAHAAPPRGCAPPRLPPRARGPLRPPLRRRVAVPRAAAVRTASQHGHPCLQTRPPYAPCDAGWLWVAVGSCKQCGGRAGAWNRASRLALRTPRTCGPPSCQAGCQARGAGAGCLAALAMSPRGRAHPRHVELARGGALAVRAGVRAALGALLGRGRGTHPLQVAPGDSG